jgi:DNA-directed RNA polymerase subunit RPC12/RpoP
MEYVCPDCGETAEMGQFPSKCTNCGFTPKQGSD